MAIPAPERLAYRHPSLCIGVNLFRGALLHLARQVNRSSRHRLAKVLPLDVNLSNRAEFSFNHRKSILKPRKPGSRRDGASQPGKDVVPVWLRPLKVCSVLLLSSPAMASDPRLDDLPKTLHLLMVNRFILLPETTLPLVLTDERYMELTESLAAADGYLGFILPGEAHGSRRFQEVGCLARINELERDGDGLNVLFEGVVRFRVLRELPAAGQEDLPRAEVEYQEFAADLGNRPEDLEGWNLERIKAALIQIGKKQTPGDLSYLEAMPPRQIIRLMAQTMPFAPSEKQALLEAPTFRAMLELLFALLAVNFLTTTPDGPQPQVN